MSEPTIIDGKATSAAILDEIKAEVDALKENGCQPGLATVLVGDRPDSATYVRMKHARCQDVGITSFDTKLPGDVTQDELLAKVSELNADPAVHGILIQLPLPSHINEETILSAVSLEKDVDGFHPLNIGKLAMKDREPTFVPCTPRGCIELLERYHVDIAGKHAVVVGRSNIVGLPVALMLLHKNATVQICHSRTPDLKECVQRADIVIAAVGKARLIEGDWLKQGATVIDVGMNSIDAPETKRGYRMVGDVDFESAKAVAGAITPVPGGVGPMTIAMLLRNTVDGAKRTCAQK